MRLLRTRNGVGRFIYLHKQPGQEPERGDASVFIPDQPADWLLTIEGSPDESARCFVVKDVNELRRLVEALNLVLDDIESGV